MKTSIEQFFSNYLENIWLYKSNGTYRFDMDKLKRFKAFINQRGLLYIEDIEDQHIKDFIADLRNRCSNATVNKHVGVLKRLWKYHNIKFEYLESIPKLKERLVTFEMISDNDASSIRKYASSLNDGINNNLLFKCLIYLLSDTGARINEILKIERKNVNLENESILLTNTKTNIDRIVFLSNNGLNAIKKMLAINVNHKYLLHNKVKNRPAVYNDAIYLMRKIKKQLGISKLHPHMFRHTLATTLLENGAGDQATMLLLGHTSNKILKRYNHMRIVAIKNIYKKTYLDMIS